ncbi:MAG: KamA family radical SAM protein [Firmicutes bacterium]|nr:KamA family radical SAM protein [Bacillota bacterium]
MEQLSENASDEVGLRPLPKFAVPISERSDYFRERYFPEATRADWNDWRWQIKHSIDSFERLGAIVKLTEAELSVQNYLKITPPLKITPYYASLLDPDDPLQPIRRTVVPVKDEYFYSPSEADDPLGEERHRPVRAIVHRYPDRVLFLASNWCSVSCRYCTRSRVIGNNKRYKLDLAVWEEGLAYIRSNPGIRDVIISGGDPLTLPSLKLEWLLARLRAIPHLEILRIGTKVPVVLPQRITPGLVRMLKRYHPLYMSIHFTHPDELTPEVGQACNMLADAGIPLGSQTVLLKGINDDVETMRRLMQGLLKIRVKPYYLYQCDPILGSSHFRTPVAKGLEIIRGLRGFTSGYAVPTFVIDAPGGGGKVPLLPDYYQGRDEQGIILKNYQGLIYRYVDLKESC